MRPLHTSLSEHCPFRVLTMLVRVLFYTFSPCLPTPAHTSHPCHHHISTQSTPNHLLSYVPHAQTTSIYHASPLLPRSKHPKDYKTSLHFLSFRDTPHIHLAIMRSALSRLSRFSVFIAHVSIPYVNTLWTQALKIFPFMRCDAPRDVRMSDSSLNLA